MASILQWFAYGLAGFIVLVSLLNPGGFFLAAFLATIIVFVALAGPFVRDYVLNASHGRWSDRKRREEQEGSR
ncbi:hypothetical protein G9464_20905 [Halostella sp. JP-L12]|uniref:hypothetical protein n=1 Tax=Halostella TaxID=1843185 RepID=UPI000EF7781E|nr:MULTISPECIES: hypothetical protein [Halostella]NHN50032.1 hypothetical protein [Halostella sp. JP-L12]